MRRNIYLPNEFWDKLKEKAKELEMRPSQYIRYIIKKFWEQEEKNEKNK